MPVRCALLAVLLVWLSGCVSVRVTPESIKAVAARAEEGADALKRWNEAVRICNEFLDSGHRKTLPEGKILLAEDGMTFVSNGVRHPIHVRCCAAGDLLIPFKMIAQERSDGFVVGFLAPRSDREIDNSFFKHLSGSTQKNHEMAGLILHELTHSFLKTGTVSVSKTVRYYAESVFLFRYRKHSMEALPFATSAEFRAFVAAHFQEQEKRRLAQPAATALAE